MSKASYSPIPLPGSSTTSSTRFSRPRVLALSALASVVLFGLSRSASAQLLFPVNNNQAPLPFDLEAHERLGEVPSGAGALWIQERAPRVAVVGGGAGGARGFEGGGGGADCVLSPQDRLPRSSYPTLES